MRCYMINAYTCCVCFVWIYEKISLQENHEIETNFRDKK